MTLGNGTVCFRSEARQSRNQILNDFGADVSRHGIVITYKFLGFCVSTLRFNIYELLPTIDTK